MTELENQTQTQYETSEIEILKARIKELEDKLNKPNKPKKLNKPKYELESCECEICKNTFKNKFTLKTHMNTVHNKERKTFTCPHCQKELKSKYYLQKHISVIHADEEKMNERNVSFEVIETN